MSHVCCAVIVVFPLILYRPD